MSQSRYETGAKGTKGCWGIEMQPMRVIPGATGTPMIH
jgi:hypothetical protein